MNTLLVSNIINLSSGSYKLEFKSNKAVINIIGDVTIYLINTKVLELTINIEDGSKLKLYKYDKLLKNNVKLLIFENNNSEIDINMTYINESDVLVDILNEIKGNNNKSNISIRNISNNNYSKIIANVKVLKNTLNNIALEDLKGINNGGYIEIEPNIICSSNEVVANHLTTIGVLDKEMVNYLMSKGINELEAKELLLKGFIFSNMDEYMKNTIGGD